MTEASRQRVLDYLKEQQPNPHFEELAKRLAGLNEDGLRQTDESTIWMFLDTLIPPVEDKVFEVAIPTIKKPPSITNIWAQGEQDPDELLDETDWGRDVSTS